MSAPVLYPNGRGTDAQGETRKLFLAITLLLGDLCFQDKTTTLFVTLAL
jgi:hypothetical protein